MARNFVKVLALKFQAAEGPTDPNPGQTIDLAAFAGDDEDLLSRMYEVFDAFVNANPGFDWQGPIVPGDPITCYVLIDKNTIITALQGGDIFNDLYFYVYAVEAITGTQAWPMLINPKRSPRYTGWTDPDGYRHLAPPSDRKKKGA